MDFKLYKDCELEARKKGVFVNYPDFDKSSYMWKIVSTLGPEHSEAICRDLNKLNNQGLTECIPAQFYYVSRGEKLPLQFLSTGERVFLLGYASLHLGKEVFLRFGFSQLTPYNQRMFMELYKSADITLVVEDTKTLDKYKRIMEGVYDERFGWE